LGFPGLPDARHLRRVALKFAFEHRSGEALDVFPPSRKRLPRDYRVEKPFAQPAERRVF